MYNELALLTIFGCSTLIKRKKLDIKMISLSYKSQQISLCYDLFSLTLIIGTYSIKFLSAVSINLVILIKYIFFFFNDGNTACYE